MKVILFQSYETGAIFHASELELIQPHIDANDEVIIVSCRGKHCGCDYNPQRNKLHCFTCRHQTKRGNKLFNGSFAQQYYDNYLDNECISSATEESKKLSDHLDDLHGWTYKNYDIGSAVVSTIVSRTRDPDVDLEAHFDVVASLAYNGLIRYEVVEKIIAETDPDLVYFFNGRHTAQRAIRRICEYQKIDYFAIEGGHNLDTYGVFKNATSHDIEYFTREMLKRWEVDSEEEIKKRTAGFYEARIEGCSRRGVMLSFTAQQNKGEMPEGWDSNKKNVAIFCTSEDEYVAVGEEWKCKTYPDQLEGLKQIAAESKKLDGIVFNLRMHPNLKGIYNDFVKEINALHCDTFRVIEAASTVSTYDLMFSSDSVVTFGSTAGIEAAYWGKPSILLGASFYMNLGGTYNPETHEEFVDLIKQDLPAKESAREAAIKYANYSLSFGIPYKDTITNESITNVLYKNTNLNGNFVFRNLLALRNKVITSTTDASVKHAQKLNKKKLSKSK